MISNKTKELDNYFSNLLSNMHKSIDSEVELFTTIEKIFEPEFTVISILEVDTNIKHYLVYSSFSERERVFLLNISNNRFLIDTRLYPVLDDEKAKLIYYNLSNYLNEICNLSDNKIYYIIQKYIFRII